MERPGSDAPGPRILAFAASLRKGSHNRKLLAVAVETARSLGAVVDHADFRAFDMPLYDADVQETTGFPAGAQELKRRLEAADGILLATPEYNYSIPGTLKNAIDWVSRWKPMPWRGKSALLMSAAPGLAGGVRGLWQTRIPLEGCGVFVHPDMYTVPKANEAFDAAGAFVDPKAAERLRVLIAEYLSAARALAAAGRSA